MRAARNNASTWMNFLSAARPLWLVARWTRGQKHQRDAFAARWRSGHPAARAAEVDAHFSFLFLSHRSAPPTSSLVVIELVKPDPRVARQIDQRRSEEPQGNDEKHRSPILMWHVVEGARESDDDEERCDDRACRGEEYGAVQQSRPALQARNIPPQVRLGRVLVVDRVQSLRAIDDAVHPCDQHGNECRDGTEEKCGRSNLRDDLGQ